MGSSKESIYGPSSQSSKESIYGPSTNPSSSLPSSKESIYGPSSFGSGNGGNSLSVYAPSPVGNGAIDMKGIGNAALRKTIHCRLWNGTLGSCRFGDGCNFIHYGIDDVGNGNQQKQ